MPLGVAAKANIKMKYAYEDLGDDGFEKLVVMICQRLLGISVIGFAKGPDGGRDARFHGTAELHPSKSAPWSGKVIIQAKHTVGIGRSCSETDFFGENSKSCIMAQEAPKIRALRDAKELDYYMLFTNRKLTAGTDSLLRSYVSKACGIPPESIYICGIEQLEMLLKNFPDIPEKLDIDPVDSPLTVSSDELAEVVEALERNKSALSVSDPPPVPRTSYEEKNRINKMSSDYAKQLRSRFLKDTTQVQRFLADPDNTDLLKKYESIVEEFQFKIIAKKKNYQSFDDVMEYLLDILFGRDPVLRSNKRLTRVLLFYMYWNCDIGEVEDATP